MFDRCIHLWSWRISVLASHTHLFSFRALVVLLVLLVLLPPVLPAGFSFLDCVRKLERSCSVWISWVTWDGSLRWSGINMLSLGECTSSLQSSLSQRCLWICLNDLFLLANNPIARPSHSKHSSHSTATENSLGKVDSTWFNDHPIRMVGFSRNSTAPINFDPKPPLCSAVSPNLQLSC